MKRRSKHKPERKNRGEISAGDLHAAGVFFLGKTGISGWLACNDIDERENTKQIKGLEQKQTRLHGQLKNIGWRARKFVWLSSQIKTRAYQEKQHADTAQTAEGLACNKVAKFEYSI